MHNTNPYDVISGYIIILPCNYLTIVIAVVLPWTSFGPTTNERLQKSTFSCEIIDFTNARNKYVQLSWIKTLDELMLAWHVRTSKNSCLPNTSCIISKPLNSK